MTRLPSDSSDFPACQASCAYKRGAHAARAFLRIVYTCLQAGRARNAPDNSPADDPANTQKKHPKQKR